jgi:hypothetical protein
MSTTCSFQQASPNEQAVILIVDDVPENLGLLHESGSGRLSCTCHNRWVKCN